ncbi:ATP-binding protein [Sinosporangium siamense]|uniref:Histidine kinase/HSP90-like ATPase domain-containing protein n=1 Tax=Sinosporangium siamense TaxID=1367973 RepID=A0A919RGK1_9ACTN|nr:ATP-binding protein [Sinosporangium siamense]GII93337.1 hypothetical protein Ssi02_35680 [Sinosporangium siamense]
MRVSDATGHGSLTHPTKIRYQHGPTRRLDIAGTPAGVGLARTWLRAFLDRIPMTAAEAENITLLTSELVTNAIVHSKSSHGEVTVLLDLTCSRVRVDVIDDGSALEPVVIHQAPDSEGGRGLWLVDRTADRWGHYHDEHGLGVWFEVELMGCHTLYELATDGDRA